MHFSFLFDGNERKGYFILRNFLLKHKFRKEDDLTSASYLHMLDLSTLVEPNQIILAILIYQLKWGKVAVFAPSLAVPSSPCSVLIGHVF